MDTAADIPLMLQDFGVDATLDGAAVRGLLDKEPVISLGVVGGNNPQFRLASTSVAGDPRGKVLAIAATNYTVRDWADDGHGITVLELEA